MERLLRNGMGKKGGGGWGGVSRMVEMCLMTVILQHGHMTSFAQEKNSHQGCVK